jgi:hypothetical protein
MKIVHRKGGRIIRITTTVKIVVERVYTKKYTPSQGGIVSNKRGRHGRR